ncbi:hypothetical protein SAMN04515620_13849 [Collimonas sp. OK607]|nr:hypothetical protein SAMN04515620_13849 [Collimonas sp. OK607]
MTACSQLQTSSRQGLCLSRVQCRQDPDLSKVAARASQWTYKFNQYWIFGDTSL